MKILGVDTTASAASVAVCDNSKILAEYFTNIKVTHSQTFMPMAESAIRLTGISYSDIDLFAVAYGPGSFTGVRIGISAIKGMAFAVNKPCIGVSTLCALAENVSGCFDGIICPVMDARCSQVYNALFCGGERLCDDRALAVDELGNELLEKYPDGRKIMFIGDGAELCFERLSHLSERFIIAPENVRFQRASSVAAVAKRLYDASPESAIDPEKLNPFYLRPPQAEQKYNKTK